MPRGLKTKIKMPKPKIVKGIPPLLGIMGSKGMPKSKAMPFGQKNETRMIPTLQKGKTKQRKI